MSEIKYVLIEMIENDISKMSGDSIIAGMFKGIRVYQPPKEDMLILIEDRKEEVIHLLNIAKYNILSLQRFDGYTKIIHCFRATKEDQESAISIISDMIKELNDADRTIDSDDNIIDTSTYASIPDDTTIIKQCTGAKNYARNNNTVHRPAHRCDNTKNVTVVPKEMQPKHFKRTKKPSKVALDKMQKKIEEIRIGTYQVKLPVIKGDDIEVAGAKNSTVNRDDRNFYMYG